MYLDFRRGKYTQRIYFSVGTAYIFSAVGQSSRHMPWLRLQSLHRVVIATFWRIFHHDGKISPAW
jgi:hypothetical protein